MISPPPLPAEALLNVAPAAAVYADGLVREAAIVAAGRWARLGQAPCTNEVYVFDAVDGEAARGDEPGCRVYFDRDYRNGIWSIYTDRLAGLAARRAALGELCAVATHEEGHNLGYDHMPGTIMAPVVTMVPAACKRWARLKLPLRHR